MDEIKLTEQEMTEEAEIWDEVLEDKAMEDYIAAGGSAIGMIRSAIIDMCNNYCKYGDKWTEGGMPKECERCPIDILQGRN